MVVVTEPAGAGFDAPGPGAWILDRTHFPGGTTLIMRELVSDAVDSAYRQLFAEFGMPARTLQMVFVNGYAYTRVVPLVGAERTSSSHPPAIVLRLATRLHPAFRARTKAARATLAGRVWFEAIDEWHDEIRPRLVARNAEFAAVDVDTVDDDVLADHVRDLLAHLRHTYQEHFRLHGHDLGPLGMLVSACADWGIAASDVLAALVGASPSTSEPARRLREIREALEAADVEPTDLDDVRAAGPEVAAMLDTYLDRHGSVLCSGYDLDSPTLVELPDLVLSTILHAEPDRTEMQQRQHERIAAELRNRVPEGERQRFDGLLEDARAAMDLRDDNGPITVEWPSGLLRLALLASGRRHARRGRLDAADQALELYLHEVEPFVRSGHGPSSLELATRAETRRAEKRMTPPRTLGPIEDPPPLDVLPGPLAELMRILDAVMGELGMVGEPAQPSPATSVLTGIGIGDTRTVGRVCAAETADAAFDRLEPGDILVTRTTTPAYNMVLTLVGGLVTGEGGPMSHAAVLSRELGLPAVIGVGDGFAGLVDGIEVEIDPDAGTVRVVGPAAAT